MTELEDRMVFMASEYYATGEGITNCLMISVNYRGKEELKARFHELFPYYGLGMEFYSRENFLKQYGNLIPDGVKNTLEGDDFGAFVWHSMFYVNYS